MAILKNWILVFEKEQFPTPADCIKAQIVIAQCFYHKRPVNERVITVGTTIKGNVYGKEGYKDGEEIITSNLKSLKPTEEENKWEATTISGSIYVLTDIDPMQAEIFKEIKKQFTFKF